MADKRADAKGAVKDIYFKVYAMCIFMCTFV